MKRRIVVEFDDPSTITPSVYLDVFGWVRDQETGMVKGQWYEWDGQERRSSRD